MTSKYNSITHQYIYHQDIVLNGEFVGLSGLQSRNLY